MKTTTKKISLLIVFIGTLCFTPTPIKAQSPAVVDSLSHTYTNDTLAVYLRLFCVYGFHIDSIQTQNLNDTLKMDVCVINHPSGAIETHDTIVQIAIANNQ